MGMQQFDFADAHKLVPNQLVKFLPGYSESQSSKVKAEVSAHQRTRSTLLQKRDYDLCTFDSILVK